MDRMVAVMRPPIKPGRGMEKSQLGTSKNVLFPERSNQISNSLLCLRVAPRFSPLDKDVDSSVEILFSQTEPI